MSSSNLQRWLHKERTWFLLAILFIFHTPSANVEALSEPARTFPQFNDDELWVISENSKASLEKREAAARSKLEWIENSRGIDTREYADALFDFVELYDHAERWTDAILYTNRLISATKKAGGPMSLGTCYKRLAYYYFMIERFDEAIDSAKTSLELLQSEHGQTSPSLLLSLQVLGDVYTRKKELDNAQSIYERMLVITEASKNKVPLDFAKASAKLADIYRRQGKLEFSEKYYRLGISVVKATIGTDNAFVPKCMYGLSLTLLAEKKFQEAEQLLKEALPLAEASLGRESGLVGAIIQRLNKQTAIPSKS